MLPAYVLSFAEGSAAERVGIGFGSGASEVKTVVEGFQMTATGLRKLGSGSVEVGGSTTPGRLWVQPPCLPPPTRRDSSSAAG
jgi:hypothetical protein